MSKLESERAEDAERHAVLRKLPFFEEFEDVELWEVLCLSAWRKVAEGTLVMREGEREAHIGILVSGTAEVSVGGRCISTVGPGESIGEMAYLDPFIGRRSASVIATAPMTYIELSVQALALASEELREHFSRRLISILGLRLVAAGQKLAETAPPARAAAEVSEADEDWSIDFSVD
jgi:CRP-like cAMP-binding protein